ncbi:hypothetical protein ACFVSU_12835 [Microbacterium sp. NPDC058062]
MTRPKVSRVIASGSGPPRRPVSSFMPEHLTELLDQTDVVRGGRH